MDILDRGIPWTELILRDRNMPNDLNLQLSQRISVALLALVVLNNQFYLSLAAKRDRDLRSRQIRFICCFTSTTAYPSARVCCDSGGET